MNEEIIHLLDRFDDEKKYWLEKLQGIIDIAVFPPDFENQPGNKKETCAIVFDDRLAAKILQIGKSSELSLYVVLLAALNVLAWRYSRSSDCIIASPMHVKDEKNYNRFILLRNTVNGDMSFVDLLMSVKTTVSDGYKNQHYPLTKVLDILGYGDREFIGIAAALQGVHKIDTGDGFSGSPANHLLFSFVRTGDRLEGEAIYDSGLFKKTTVERIVKRYLIVFDWLLSNSKTKLSEMEPATPEEKEILLNHFNRTEVQYPGPQIIHELFEAAASRCPCNTAVIFEDCQWTYSRLNETANQWAGLLTDKYIKPGTAAAIMLESSVEMVMAIMAILKSGGAYLPLEPDYPAQRIKQMLDDSGAGVLLTVSSFSSLLHEIQPGIPVIFIDKEDVSAYSTVNIGVTIAGSNLAYIIYTSGTTGTPKGVMVEHKGLVNYTMWRLHSYDYTSSDVALQVLSYVFDGFMANFYTSLVSGGTLVIVPGSRKVDTDYLKEKIKKHGVTNMSLVPGLYKELIDKVDGQYLASLRFVVLAGEKADAQLIQMSREKIPGIVHIIEYGPTEATVTAAANIGIGPDETAQIGRPIANVRVYILDDLLKLMPVGIAGEIYIGGRGVARGYLNNDTLTLQRFIPDPFAAETPGEKLYRTGDLGRWTDDGKIEFLGRVDRQVKIGGIRVEPGEIKNYLLTHGSIMEAEVLDGENNDGNKYLYAFVVSRETIPEPELRSYLGRHLPHYMIPAFIIPLAQMPLTSNGKLDRKALEEMNRKMNYRAEYDAPRNDLEQKLIDVLQEVLGIERLGISDNFFENGGDSIKAVQAATRMQKLGFKVETVDFFVLPIIKDLAKQVKPIERAIHQGIVEGKVELTPIQRWFFAENISGSHYFNQDLLLWRKKGFDAGVIETLFNRLVEHHDILRVVFEMKDGQVIQRNRGFEPGENFFHLEVIDLTGQTNILAEIETHAVRIRKSINYNVGPLLNLGLFKTGIGDYLLIVLHYLVVDDGSWRILLEDLSFGLQKLENGETLIFRDKTDSYRYWAERLINHASSYKLLKELDYWKGIEKRSFTPLPYDHEVAIENRKRKNSEVIYLELDEAKTMELLKEANRPYNTNANDLMLAALALALKDWAGIEGVPVELESHGRAKIDPGIDIDRTIGSFASRFPLFLDIGQTSETPDIAAVVKTVKETLRRVPHHGIGYGILKYLTPQDKKEDLTFMIEPEIRFNLLAEFDIDFALQKQTRPRDQEETLATVDLYTSQEISPESELKPVFDINVTLKDGKASLKFLYNKCRYERKTVEKLVACYQAKLFEIIEHGMKKKSRDYTPSDVAPGENLSIADLDKIKEVFDRNGSQIEKIYSLSPMQEGMLFHSMMDKNSRVYFEQNVFTFQGKIDPVILEKSFNLLIQRHETLRTVFYLKDIDKPFQIVLNQFAFKLGYEDISDMAEDVIVKRINDYLEKDREKGFDMYGGGALNRGYLFKISPNSYKLIYTFHHAMLDGWCLWIISNDLAAFYRSLVENSVPLLEPVAPYRDYITWLKNQDKTEGMIYWQNYLDGYNRENLISKYAKPEKDGKNGSIMHTFDIDAQLREHMMALVKENRVTLNSIFQAIWGIMLHKYNYVDDVVFGGVVSGRPAEIDCVETTVGLFINTIPIRVTVNKEKTFLELLAAVHQKSIASMPYEYLPLPGIQALSSLKSNLFDHIMTFAPIPSIDRSLELNRSDDHLGFTSVDRRMYHQSSFDFNLVVFPGEVISVTFIFNSSVYEIDFIKKLEKYFMEVFQQVLSNPVITIEDIHITLDLTRSASSNERQDGGDFEF